VHGAPVLRQIRPLRTLKAQTSNHSISFTGIKMRSSQYAAPRQDTDTGGGASGVQGGGLLPEVWLSRPRCVYKPFVERFPSRQAPLALKGLFCGYNDLQEGFEVLWSIVAWGRHRNLGLFSRLVRGVWRPCEPPRDSLFPLPNPLISPVTSWLGVVWRLSKPHS
jgi:hypothetical protein